MVMQTTALAKTQICQSLQTELHHLWGLKSSQIINFSAEQEKLFTNNKKYIETFTYHIAEKFGGGKFGDFSELSAICHIIQISTYN